jgi:hypothetical protein
MGGGQAGSQTTQTVPWKGVQPFLTEGFDMLSSQMDIPLEFFPGSTVAPQSENTIAGIDATAGAATPQQGVADQTSRQFNFFTGDALDPDTNKYLSNTAAAAIKPVFENLTKNVLPGIGRGAVQSGGFGGTAHFNLGENSINRAVEDALDKTFGLYSGAYESGADRAAGLIKTSPFIQSTFTAPGTSLINAGGMQDAFTQAGINEDIDRFNFGQTGEFDRIMQYINTLTGVPFGSSTNTSGGGGTSPFNAALAGGLGGAALQSMIPSLALSQPWMLPLMMAGGSTLFN